MSPIISRIGFNRGFWRRLDSEPTYSISASTSSVNEGSSVTFTVTTTNVDSGTILYWTTNTISGTVNASDFSDSATTGSFTITNGTGSIIRTLSNDVATEGSESFQLQIRTGSISGVIVASSTTVTINDTSTPFAATGGTKTTIGSYTYHDFTGSSTLTVTGNPKSAYILLIAGGGGGSSNNPGDGGTSGGGAGGVVIAPLTLTPGSYTVSVGQGGPGVSNSGHGGNGTNSTFGPDWVAQGGGGGINYTPAPYTTQGGSPGGSYGNTISPLNQTNNPALPTNSRTFGYGNQGNVGSGPPGYGGGGGGGAGGPGGVGSAGSLTGVGGIGLPTAPIPWLNGTPFFAPTSQYFAGGGGTSSRIGGAAGGLGGGGPAGTPGTSNTGGGGGGAYPTSGAGGPGRAIIAYLTT